MWNTFGVHVPRTTNTRGAPLRGDPWLLSATASRYSCSDKRRPNQHDYRENQHDYREAVTSISLGSSRSGAPQVIIAEQLVRRRRSTIAPYFLFQT